MLVTWRLLVGLLAFVLLDGVWLGLVMRQFYRDRLAPIARMNGGSLAPDWLAAGLVYVALGAGLAVFVVPRATTVAGAAAYGALFGLVTYGVYDFTNMATLKHWTWSLAVVDVCWGAFAAAVAAAAIKIVVP